MPCLSNKEVQNPKDFEHQSLEGKETESTRKKMGKLEKRWVGNSKLGEIKKKGRMGTEGRDSLLGRDKGKRKSG